MKIELEGVDNSVIIQESTIERWVDIYLVNKAGEKPKLIVSLNIAELETAIGTLRSEYKRKYDMVHRGY